MTAAYQVNAYQNNAYQVGPLVFDPAFQPCVFQFDAFQTAECPVPPEPIMDGHDGGRRKKALKKLRELEDKRIAMVREDGERRKLLLRHAIDPEAKAEYEAKLARENAISTENPQKAAKEGVKNAVQEEIAKIDAEIAKIENLKRNMQLQSIIKAELNTIMTERAVREQQIRKQIRDADDELALMMMM